MAKSLSDRVEGLERNALRHEKQIQVIRRLIEEGMRMLRINIREQRELRVSVKELVNGMKRGSNGHGKRKLAIQ
jgi:hypothetical protein